MRKIIFGVLVIVTIAVLLGTLGRPLVKEMRQWVRGDTTDNSSNINSNTSTDSRTYKTIWTVAMAAPGNGKDEIDGIAVDESGNMFYGGPFEKTVSFNGQKHTAKTGTDVFLSKVSPDGETIWFTSFDSGGDDFMWDMEAAPDGDMYISGGYAGTLTINGTNYVAARDGSAYYARIDGTDGTFEWIVTAGVPGTGTGVIDSERTAGGNEIKTDTDGNAVAILSAYGDSYRIGNKTYTPAGGVMDSFVVKISPTGTVLWAYQFPGDGRKQGRAIAVTGDNSIILGHQLIGTLGTGKNQVKSPQNRTPIGVVSLISKNGELQFTKAVTSDGFSNVRGAGGDSDGNVYITGVVTGNSDVAGTPITSFKNGGQFVAKLTSRGDVLWVRLLGNESENSAGEMITTPDGFIAISGVNGGSDYHLYDERGNVLVTDVHTVDSRRTRSTLTVFSPTGTLVGTHEPTKTDVSNGGVLEATPDGCIIYQSGYYGTITFDNGDTYTAANNAREAKPDQDQALAKVCFE